MGLKKINLLPQQRKTGLRQSSHQPLQSSCAPQLPRVHSPGAPLRARDEFTGLEYERIMALEKRLYRIERILAITQTLVYPMSLEQILPNIVEAATELTDCESAAILLWGEHFPYTLRFAAVVLCEDRLFGIPEPIDTSIVSAAYTVEQPVIVNDARNAPPYFACIGDLIGYRARSLLAVPLRFQDCKIGMLQAENKRGNQPFDADDAEVLAVLALQATIAIENARLYRQAQLEILERFKAEEALRQLRNHMENIVQERTAELHHLAITDPLTGVFNRRHLLILGEQALEQARRYQRPLAALMIDIDHFKRINDRYGHVVGDEALKRLAECLQSNLRAADILGRYGGEEFVVLMPETDLETAQKSAERLIAHIRALTVETEHEPIHFTTSIGVAVLDPVHDATVDLLIQHADQAMYAAKRAGRNRVFALR